MALIPNFISSKAVLIPAKLIPNSPRIDGKAPKQKEPIEKFVNILCMPLKPSVEIKIYISTNGWINLFETS